MSTCPAVFVDRDGTLMEEVNYCRDPELVRLLPGVIDGLQALRKAGYRIVIVTNQSGIGRGIITEPEYHAVHVRLVELLGNDLVDATYFCPDAPGTPSTRRKPAPGMLLEAASQLGLDLARSWMIGDKTADLECAHAAGSRGILVKTGYGSLQDSELAEFVAKDFASAASFILKHNDAR